MYTANTIVAESEILDAIEDLFHGGAAEIAYARPVACLEVHSISKFYGLLLAIWQVREHDLQKLYPLNTPEQRADFLAWCVVHGQHEYQALRELTTFWDELAKPAVIAETQWSGGISRLVQLAIRGRPDLLVSPALRTADEQKKALSWFYVQGGYRELGSSARAIPSWKRSFFIGKDNLENSVIAALIYECRPDLQSTFDLKTTQGTRDFSHWLLTHAMTETGLPLFISPSLRAWPSKKKPRRTVDFGVNLIGYAYGELGIGEDVRMAARALSEAEVPFTIINISPGKSIRQSDRSVEQWVGKEPKYLFNIICLTALENLRVYLEQGEEIFAGRYNIGYWPWELHNWPTKWKHCFNLVDEVWASSKHIQRSVKETGTCAVSYMPMSVPSRPPLKHKDSTRKRFGLPSKKTLFVFSFDGNSYINRKNPSGIVEAFTQAFHEDVNNVGLVIKCMRPDPHNPEWQKILSHSKKDNRIKIIDQILTKDDVMKLYQCCDCFVSLHRAEGFGRGIAEAITLQLEVIATNYGGNIEFCEAAKAYLVPYKLIRMDAEDYVEAKNNFWAEPDIGAAAHAMQDVHKKIGNRVNEREASARTEIIDKLFSPSVIGSIYKKRLIALYNALHIE